MKSSNQIRKFKNQVLTVDELRRHRREETVTLRKRKQDEEFCKLHKIEQYKDQEFDLYTIFDENLIGNLNSTDEDDIVSSLQTYSHLINFEADGISDMNSTIDDIISLGLLPVFIDLFNSSEPNSKVNLAALNLLESLTNQPEYIEEIFEYISVPSLLELLSCSSSEHTLRDLLSLINAGVFYWESIRDKFLDSNLGVLKLVVNLFHKTTSESLRRSSLVLIRNFYRHFVEVSQISEDYLELLKDLFASAEAPEEMVALGLYGLVNIAEMSAEHIDRLVERGLASTGLLFLARNNPLILAHTLNFVYTLACHQKFAPLLSGMNVFDTLWQMLERSSGSSLNELRLSISSTLAQLLKLSANDHDFVVRSGYVPRFVNTLLVGHYRMRCEAVMALHVLIMHGSEQTVRNIADNEGVLQAICDMLTVMDVETVLCCLECVERVLSISQNGLNKDYKRLMEEQGGVEKLEFLLNSQNLDVYIMAHDIVERFFDDDAIELDEVVDICPMPNGVTNFAF